MKQDRYFFIAYSGEKTDKKQFSGMILLVSEKFPSYSTIKKSIDVKGDFSLSITSMFEFKTKEDYEDFCQFEEDEPRFSFEEVMASYSGFLAKQNKPQSFIKSMQQNESAVYIIEQFSKQIDEEELTDEKMAELHNLIFGI